MLPKRWQKKLVDMNTTDLTDDDIKWADYVFISAMVVQNKSVGEVIARVKKLGKKIVAGGPLFTAESEKYSMVDHLVLNEAELTLPSFLKDLENNCAKHLYTTSEHPDIQKTPVPLWSLLKFKQYSSMNVQYSRGCPFNCEFCNITVLYGRVPRTKAENQLINELESLYQSGWRGGVFIVDDNFIGNKMKLKTEILPVLISWMEKRKYPFVFSTEASINLADDPELMQMMVKAGFNNVFIGIETPNKDSLSECGKFQNQSRNLVSSIKRIQHFGMQVIGGFIVGFDHDPRSIFRNQIDFIQKSGIVTAMVGLLSAPRGTRLYQRLQNEKRITGDMTGNNTDFSLNFTPKMKEKTLITGYHKILNTIYSPKHYYERIKTLLKEYKPRTNKKAVSYFHFHHLIGLFNCIWFLGIKERGRFYYWKLLAPTLFKRPRSLPLFMTLAAYGYHFRKLINQAVPVTT